MVGAACTLCVLLLLAQPPDAAAVTPCVGEGARAVQDCAELWVGEGVTPQLSRYDVVSVMNFKATAPAALVNWVDYHLLLGVQHMVFIDNNCGRAQTAPAEAALSPYVKVGVATLVTRYRCLSFNNTFGAVELRYLALSRAEAAASPLRGRMHPDTLVLAIDDDEYVVLPNPHESLRTVAASMKRSRASSDLPRKRAPCVERGARSRADSASASACPGFPRFTWTWERCTYASWNSVEAPAPPKLSSTTRR